MSSATWRTEVEGRAVTTPSVITSRISTTATYTCAVATTGDETLLDEQHRRVQAGAAGIAAGILTMAGGALAAYVYKDIPAVPVIDALRERLEAGAGGPTLKARQALWYHDSASELVLVAVVLALAAAAIGLVLSHLF